MCLSGSSRDIVAAAVLRVVLCAVVVTPGSAVASSAVAHRSDFVGPFVAPAEAETSGTKLDRGYLRVAGSDRGPLVDALSLRVPHLGFEPFSAAADATNDGLAAFVELRPEPAGPEPDTITFALTIVVSDGRAFDRRIETRARDDETPRLLASTVANLLLAIEAGTVQADRGDVPLPVIEPLVCPTCECPQPAECPVIPAAPEPSAPVEPAVAPRVELGPVVMAASTLGLGAPEEADRFAAAGATVGLHARLRRGAFFGAELRTSGRGEPLGARLVRLRAAVGAGYHLRARSWSLGASLWGTVEPWWVTGAPVEPAPVPYFGFAARLRPALVVPRLGGRPLSLTIGPTFELAASAAFRGDGPEVGLIVVTESDLEASRLRMGGLEFSTGLSATLWFGLPRERARR